MRPRIGALPALLLLFGCSRSAEVPERPNVILLTIDALRADHFIRRLLEDEQLTSNTGVIVTADHGEAFLDHNQLGHGHTLYEKVHASAITAFRQAYCSPRSVKTITRYSSLEPS